MSRRDEGEERKTVVVCHGGETREAFAEEVKRKVGDAVPGALLLWDCSANELINPECGSARREKVA